MAKPQNEMQVVHIASLDDSVRPLLLGVQDEFWRQKPNHTIRSSMCLAATYLFETPGDAACFGELLSKKNIPFSYHPASEYDNVITKHYSPRALAMHNTLEEFLK